MKRRLQNGSARRCISFLSALAFIGISLAQSTSITYDYTGSMQYFTVPAGVTTIQLEAWGAQGGGGLQGVTGGLGAYASGTFAVTSGQTITILVGGMGLDGTDDGEQAGGSGGGGTFIADVSNTPMLVAGGGGGAMGRNGLPVNGGPGLSTENGASGEFNGGAGGTMGSGGNTWPWTGWHSGTGGGGFLTDCPQASNGNTGSFGTNNGPGIAFVNGGAGGYGGSMGRAGGFGGGGAAGFTGGGGGGYSGGGSGTHDAPQTYNGGGGGSYNAGTNQVIIAGMNQGNGSVVITLDCNVNVDVTQNGSLLSADFTGTNVSYQWLDCDDSYSIVVGETNQSFTPSVTGNYAVEINDNGCVDTSMCLLVDYTGIGEITQASKELVKIIDLMGRETEFKSNIPLIYIYSDGSREKVLKLED